MNYKPILPSTLLGIQGEEESGSFSHSFANYGLKCGVVTKVHEIEDKTNLCKVVPEYDVVVVEQDQNRGVTSTAYKNCMVKDLLGGVADFFEMKLRTPTKDDFKSKLNAREQNGSVVLILCLDGLSDKAIIIASLCHPARKTTLTKENGQHAEGEINGLNVQINKDGELTVTFKSASDNDGKYKDDKAGGTFFKIEKDGSFELSDNKEDKIRIDKTKQTIDVLATKDINITTKENIKLTATKNAELSLKDLLLNASGKATISIKEDVSFECSANVKAKATMFDIQADSMIKFKTKTIQIDGQQIMLGQGGSPALTMSTMYLGTGNLGMPVISSASGPFSSKVFIAS